MPKNAYQDTNDRLKGAEREPRIAYQVPIVLPLDGRAESSLSCVFGGVDDFGNCPHGHIPNAPPPTGCTHGSYHR